MVEALTDGSMSDNSECVEKFVFWESPCEIVTRVDVKCFSSLPHQFLKAAPVNNEDAETHTNFNLDMIRYGFVHCFVCMEHFYYKTREWTVIEYKMIHKSYLKSARYSMEVWAQRSSTTRCASEIEMRIIVWKVKFAASTSSSHSAIFVPSRWGWIAAAQVGEEQSAHRRAGGLAWSIALSLDRELEENTIWIVIREIKNHLKLNVYRFFVHR